MTAERHVYLVDDDDAIRQSASVMLKTSGLVVTTFASGVDFLSKARHLESGCVLLDVRMPKLDGLAVQAELKACGIALPVIVITGHGNVTVAVGAMKAGAVNFSGEVAFGRRRCGGSKFIAAVAYRTWIQRRSLCRRQGSSRIKSGR